MLYLGFFFIIKPVIVSWIVTDELIKYIKGVICSVHLEGEYIPLLAFTDWAPPPLCPEWVDRVL